MEAEALRKAEAIAEAERKRVAASIRGSLNKQVGLRRVVLSASPAVQLQESAVCVCDWSPTPFPCVACDFCLSFCLHHLA